MSAAEQAAYLPENQCDRADPPVLILHGTADTTVDIRQSMDMAAALAKAKVAHELIVVEGAPHTFDLHPKGTGWTRVTVRWAANGDQTRVETRSVQPDLTEPTLDFLGRTIGK